MTRLERKLAEVQRWVDSVGQVGDWPAAIALALLKTRPSRDRFPRLWLAPRRLAGMRVRVDPANMSHLVIYEEIFIDGLYDLDLVGFVPDTVIDCGAFEGYFSCLAHARFPSAQLIAFEPDADNYQGLVANAAKNRMVIDVREEAVSTRHGSAAFSGGGCGGHLGEPGPGTSMVDLVDLRQVISELHADRLLLKLDIEGEELTLIPALLPVLPAQCAVFFEWHHGRDAYQGVAALLEANGFTMSITRENRVDGTVFIDAFARRD